MYNISVRVLHESPTERYLATLRNHWPRIAVYLVPVRDKANKNPRKRRDLLWFRVYLQCPGNSEVVPFAPIMLDSLFDFSIERLLIVLEIFCSCYGISFIKSGTKNFLINQIAQVRTGIED